MHGLKNMHDNNIMYRVRMRITQAGHCRGVSNEAFKQIKTAVFALCAYI